MMGLKDGKLIKCPKCKSENINQEDYSIEVIDEETVHIEYDVWCNDCKHSFEIVDIFKYKNSK